jgi:hypothetical protein
MSTSRLTKASAAKYADMADSVEQAWSQVQSIQRRVSELEKQVRNNPASASETEHELSRQRARLGQEQARHIALSRVTTAVRTWLMQLGPGVELIDAESTSYEPDKGESCADAVRRLRDEIDKLSSTRTTVSRALLPVQEVRAQANAYVDALAERGKPRMALIDDKLSITHSFDGFAANAADAAALLAWMDPDIMKDRLWLDVSHFLRAEDKNGLETMTKAKRVAKLAELDGRILALEREEEALVCRAADEGTTIPRRDNASPAVILGVVVAPVAKRAAVA